MKDPAENPFLIMRADSLRHGDPVRHLEAHPGNFPHHPVRFLFQHIPKPFPIGFLQYGSKSGRHTGILKQEHRAAERSALCIGGPDFFQLALPDARHRKQRLRIPVQNLQRTGTECIDNAPGYGRSDPFDLA